MGSLEDQAAALIRQAREETREECVALLLELEAKYLSGFFGRRPYVARHKRQALKHAVWEIRKRGKSQEAAVEKAS